MKDYEKQLENIEVLASEDELLEVISKYEGSCDLSHGSHSQHSSSAQY